MKNKIKMEKKKEEIWEKFKTGTCAEYVWICSKKSVKK